MSAAWLSALLLMAAAARAQDSPAALPSPSPAPPGAALRVTTLRGDLLHAVPRPNDVWSAVRDVPGVVLDRTAVGPSETGLQSTVVSHGDDGSGAVWTLDGVDVTDPVSPGATLLYAPIDACSAVVVRTGALDARVRTAGAQVALTLGEPAARAAGALHVRGTAGALQAQNTPEALRARPFFRSRTDAAWSAGGDLGGNVRGGRLWLWGAASLDALRQQTFTEHEERLRTSFLAGRARARVGSGSLGLLAVHGGKRHDDRDTGLSTAPEARWRQTAPTDVLSLEGERSLRALAVHARASWVRGGFRLDPQGGTAASALSDFAGVLRGSYETLETRRPRTSLDADVSGSASGLGLRHDWSAGAGWRRSRAETSVAWPGNGVLAFEQQSVFFRTFRLTGFAIPTRDERARTQEDEASAWAQDTARAGRLTVTLGARLDRLRGRALASSVDANPAFPDLLPAVAHGDRPVSIRWTDVLPRAGLDWDLAGDGSARAGLAYAAYAGALGAGSAGFDDPLAHLPSLTYYWRDANANHAVDPGELDLLRGRLGAAGLDPDRPGSTVSPDAIAATLRAPRTHELSLSYDQRLGGVEVSLRSAWRRRVGVPWTPLRGLTLADYAIRGAVSDRLFGRDYSVGYYAPVTTSRIVPGNGRLLTNRDGYHQDAVSLEATAGGGGTRLRWSAWVAWTDWREWLADRTAAVQDPTPLDTGPLRDGGPIAVSVGGLGRGDLFVNARFTGGALARASLPLSLGVALRLDAREGFPIPYFQQANSGDPTAGSKNVLVAPTVDAYRLPALVLLDARIDRGFGLGRGRLTAALDAYNVLNRGTALQAARDVELSAPGRAREVLRPRLVVLGLEYRF